MWEPFGPIHSNQSASWKSGPNERGTLNILSSCVITLVLCVYTALHLNIPEQGKATLSHQFKSKTLWLFIGLFAPEVVAYIAFQQWRDARKLESEIKNSMASILPEKRKKATEEESGQGEPNEKRSHPWTRVHSHYAVMGGFVFDSSTASLNFFPDNRTQLTLTPYALVFIAKNNPGVIPDISEESILDKSKANQVAKIIACIQALWFVAQIIGRLSSRYPICLLEMNTFAHALCCLAIYVAWWDKPLDISEPTVIPLTRHNEAICAWMIMESYIGSHRPCALDEPGPPNCKAPFGRLITDSSYSSGIMEVVEGATIHHLRKEYSCYGFTFFGLLDTSIMGSRTWRNYPWYIPLTPSDLECLRLASSSSYEVGMPKSYMDEYMILRTSNLPRLPWLNRGYNLLSIYLDTIREVAAKFGGPVISYFENLRQSSAVLGSSAVFWMGLLSATSLYGAMHLIAWNGPFPTNIEKLLWQISGTVIVAPLPLVVFMAIVIAVSVLLSKQPLARSKPTDGDIFRMLQFQYLKISAWTVILFFLLFIPLYILARMYLVVESFINVAYLPAGVYEEPQWSRYIPHIGSG